MPHISLKAEEIFNLGGFPVTNTLILSTLVLLLLSGLGFFLSRRLRLVPAGMQNVAEFILENLLQLMDSVLGERRKSERYLPLVATIFLFILFSNWLGLLPGVGSLGIENGHEFTPLLRAPASDLNFTLALGLLTVIAINIFGAKALGIRAHLGKYFQFRNPVMAFVGLLELVSEFAKVISFSFRLFGNILAGEVLLIIVSFLVPYAAPLPFLFLEIFVGFVQAFVFAMLALVFIAIHTVEHSEIH